MHRHPALRDLSRDHHILLLHARRLEGVDPRHPVAAARRGFERFAQAPLPLHVGEEALVVASLLDPALAAAFRADRAELLEIARTARAGLRESPGACPTARGLRDHVALCEKRVFPWLQEHVDATALQDLGEGARRYRLLVRPGSAGPRAVEECFL